MDVRVTDIVSLDFELIVYRKGSLHAHLNLERGYFTWRDSWQWCNNFTRTLSDEQARQIRIALEAGLSQFQQTDQPLPDERETISWLISLNLADGQLQTRQSGDLTPPWLPLKHLIEQISRICFYH